MPSYVPGDIWLTKQRVFTVDLLAYINTYQLEIHVLRYIKYITEFRK
jgi:hypothetical protein